MPLMTLTVHKDSETNMKDSKQNESKRSLSKILGAVIGMITCLAHVSTSDYISDAFSPKTHSHGYYSVVAPKVSGPLFSQPSIQKVSIPKDSTWFPLAVQELTASIRTTVTTSSPSR